MESPRVAITVLKIITDRGSPWYTPIWSGMGLVVQDCAVTTALRLEYRLATMFLKQERAL